MSHAVDILIPTFNNYEYLHSCLMSILSDEATHGLFRVTVINNGHKESCNWIPKDHADVIQAGKNLGWEGALKLGLEKTTAPYVIFLNDDTVIPPASRMWVYQMLQHFRKPEVGAVGPSSNVVMGFQNIFTYTPMHIFSSKFLIGFCFMAKREAVIKAGGIDDSLPGGDDLDLSIRLRKAGYTLITDKTVFVYHHGFKTGSRVNGESNQRNGWNSFEMMEKTNHALIRKHGFKVWWDCMKGSWERPELPQGNHWEDTEGIEIRKHVKEGKIIDVGCGNNKTLPGAIGIDLVKKNDIVETLNGNPESQADVQADVSQPLPFEDDSIDTIIARHILEHLIDPVIVLKGWYNLLKKDGKLIIAVPNNARIQSIPMNQEHVHGWTPESLKSLLEVCGFTVIEQIDPHNGVSFITICERTL